MGEGIYQQPSPRTITDLLEDIESVDSLTALPGMRIMPGRLNVISGEQDWEVSGSLRGGVPMDPQAYLQLLLGGVDRLGTGVTHNAISGILQSAENLMIAAGYAVSGAKDAIEDLAGICRDLIAVPHDRGVADGDLVTSMC